MVNQHDIDVHFRRVDPVMAKVIGQVGPFVLKPKRDRFKTLVTSIISQQISTAAARTIRARLDELIKPRKYHPQTFSELSTDELRSVGVSQQKASYIADLSLKCLDGTVELSRLARLDDEAVIEQLVQVKGIGRWSAQMFLIFSLGRPNVFPHDDLGVRNAIQRIYEHASPLSKAELLEVGQRWEPYASVASWYCWRYLEQMAAKGKR